MRNFLKWYWENWRPLDTAVMCLLATSLALFLYAKS